MGYYKKIELEASDHARTRRLRTAAKLSVVRYYQQFWQNGCHVVDLSKFAFSASPATELGASCADPDFERLYPITHGFLTSRLRSDGKLGESGTLTIFPDDGHFKVRLADRNRHADLWASGGSITDAIRNLEALFSATPIPWRRAKVWGGGKMR